ncbi:hypothetical protein BBBOND_0211390 [Babesia bigemina]|uniref:Uncharacterized protein n=1 Tax=Babesia bigemina TaxID=5866 RepID=A0A061D7M6_BABBI|nr:hypothetical protein BBBOND_0211390 [Babesia bigemina]CDR95992.1 hypothetical protein BBBOND_0211390 [Babesia bigemina]|eukprot:XP_012768178.1 hypothetical protein BBBOND_0211390 [Babesia bigemina]
MTNKKISISYDPLGKHKMAEVKNNKCECKPTRCGKGDEPCANPQCIECKYGCDADCKGCEKNCKDGKPCKCCTPVCGCPTNCYGDDKKSKCKGQNSCERCKVKCKDSDKCICHRCSCGKQCTGVICSCCSWCDPKNCSGKKCDGYVIGRCEGNGPCKGHVKYDNDGNDNYGAVLNRNDTNRIPCDGKPHPGKKCTGNNCNWISADDIKDGCCLKFCTYCGDLCGQDKFRRCCYIATPVVITVLAFLIFRFMLPEKFHAITTKIRAAFPSPPRHPGRSLSNLVGDRLPEEMNVDRYAAFRPKAFAGLA